MGWLDYALLALVGAAVIGAVVRLRRRGSGCCGRGGCDGCCSGGDRCGNRCDKKDHTD